MKTRSALQNATQTYLAAHFYDGVVSIFAKRDGMPEFIIQIVANKYNPANYWCVTDLLIHPSFYIFIAGLVVGDHIIQSTLTSVKLQAKSWSTYIITSKAMWVMFLRPDY
jgi:hypothetical protein